MLMLYVPGTGLWHRMPAGPKLVLLMAAVLGISLPPATWATAAASAAVLAIAYAVGGLGLRELWRQLRAIRWLLALILLSQLVFLGPEDAVANTARAAAAIGMSAIVSLTTPPGVLLAALERGLRPLAALRVDPERAALVLAVAINAIPVLRTLAREVREAQAARGGPASLLLFAVPFLVAALKYADELGDALAARGV
jgi:biotin transport system permease protein